MPDDFDEIAADHALRFGDNGDGWYGPVGLYAIERREDGLHAVAEGKISTVGLTVAAAEVVMLSWCPVPVDIDDLIEEGAVEEARQIGANFVRMWDLFGPGAEEEAPCRPMENAL